MEILQNGANVDFLSAVTEFIRKNAQTYTFPNLGMDKKQQLINEIFRYLRSSDFHSHEVCLEAVRILSRDKKGLEELFTQEHLNVLMHLAGLVIDQEDTINQPQLQLQNVPVIIEAQKCLCNLIYNSKAIQRICSMNGCVEGIMLRLRTYRDLELPHDIKFFDMRMLFLLTALCADIRPKLRSNLHGLIYLMEVLDLILKSNAELLLEQNRNQKKEGKKRYSRGSKRERGNKNDAEQYVVPCLTKEEIDLACEVLKVLFNLTVNIDRYNLDEEEEAHFMRLVSILHDILLCNISSTERKDELFSHTVNLLTTMPASSYEELLIPLVDMPGGKSDNKEFEYDGMNVEAIVILLQFLENRIDKKMQMKESLTPILTCLCECARNNRTIRKYLRIKVLPPLKDVMNRPEEGTTIRNKLVKLMTSPLTDVKELVADFIFVLCKENVGRLIKYTGYGNAAGLLANRGLMHGGQGHTGNYSSESDDSDTEEYRKYKDRINPVLGCYEEPRASPLEGMSEEQKEYEAMQLVNMMDKLARDGVLQPMRVGSDGKPHPVDHVLELQE